MYIDPFWAGVAATLLAEVAAITALVIIKVSPLIYRKSRGSACILMGSYSEISI